jgi:hypothetical protein
MLGHNVKRRLEDDPELFAAWELYQLCRQQQLVIYEKPTGRKDGSKILSTTIWTQGLTVLPNGSGIYHEDYIMTKYFLGFLMGERQAAAKLMSKKGK